MTDDAERLAKQSVDYHNKGKWDLADEYLDRSLQLRPSEHKTNAPDYKFERLRWEELLSVTPKLGSLHDQQLTNLYNYGRVVRPGDVETFPAYYTFKLVSGSLEGQRDPEDRLQYVPEGYLVEKSVLDLGCNLGGMLFEIKDQINWGVGCEIDNRLVNFANRFRSATLAYNIDFYTFDLENEPLELITDMLPELPADDYVDVVFLLAVCAHIKNWREVIAFTAKISSALLFESNGHEYEQFGQIRQLHRCYDEVTELAPRGAPGIGARRLFLCNR